MWSKKLDIEEKSEARSSVDIFTKIILYDNLVLGSWMVNYRMAMIILTTGWDNLGMKSRQSMYIYILKKDYHRVLL